MEKIRNLSLKKTMVLYLCIALLTSFFLSVLLTYAAERTQKRIWGQYIEEGAVLKQIEMEEQMPDLEVEVSRVSSYIMTDRDNAIVEACDFITTWDVLILSVAGCVTAMFLFYRNKLRIPLKILVDSSEKIRESTLDFTIEYKNKDEMGQVCDSFEKMRTQLLENNQRMWQMVENERNLRAAISHDMRAPLAVLKGYEEMLLELVCEEELEKESIREMLEEEIKQTKRLSDFLDITRTMCKLEERKPKYKAVSYKELKKRMIFTVRALCKEKGLKWKLKERTTINEIYVDDSIILEVVENMLANAVRYAKEEIQITLCMEQPFFVIEVVDDGEGFSESFETLTKSYYCGNAADSLTHFGLGLYLCRIFCEAHGGKLKLGNNEKGGAYAKAYFSIK
ncbi:MAG: HAMP domain-containing histidine kinase [Roseburia sp.]|nr:HAMP domain-containing histidine kinase [Roseburia sp.]MCM1277847.1 HAMP domain-containing histidine kinase [Robinsoniella sp.]